jgi:hypothetical protein
MSSGTSNTMTFSIIYRIDPRLKVLLKILGEIEGVSTQNLLARYYRRLIASKYDDVIGKINEFAETEYSRIQNEKEEVNENIERFESLLPLEYNEFLLEDDDLENYKQLKLMKEEMTKLLSVERRFEKKLDNYKKEIDYIKKNYDSSLVF